MRIGVRALEDVMTDGWRALEEVWLGDWLLRASHGFTQRGNSALVIDDPGLPLAAAVSTVAVFRCGLPPPSIRAKITAARLAPRAAITMAMITVGFSSSSAARARMSPSRAGWWIRPATRARRRPDSNTCACRS